MYEILCHLGDLFFQGLLTSLFVLLLAWWYEKRTAIKKARTAATFISVEIDVHIMVLDTLTSDKKPFKDNPTLGLSSNGWEGFCRELAPFIEREHLRELVIYHNSLRYINPLLFNSKLSKENLYSLRNTLRLAKEVRKSLADWETSFEASGTLFGKVQRLQSHFLDWLHRKYH